MGLVMTMKKMRTASFGNQSGCRSPIPTMQRMVPRVVALVPAWMRLYESINADDAEGSQKEED